jgi:hypothetical protein
MGLFFLAGFFFLMRQQRVVQVTPDGVMSVPLAVAAPATKPRPRQAAAAPPAAGVGQGSAPSGPLSLDDMKETLFRLEFRRQAGTISDDDYARDRARVEAAIRDFVRG